MSVPEMELSVCLVAATLSLFALIWGSEMLSWVAVIVLALALLAFWVEELASWGTGVMLLQQLNVLVLTQRCPLGEVVVNGRGGEVFRRRSLRSSEKIAEVRLGDVAGQCQVHVALMSYLGSVPRPRFFQGFSNICIYPESG